MFLEWRAVKEGGDVLGNAGDVGVGTDSASPSGAVCAVSSGKDVLVGEEGGCDLFPKGIVSSCTSATMRKKPTYLEVFIDINSSVFGQS
jgi:hypothetical protein